MLDRRNLITLAAGAGCVAAIGFSRSLHAATMSDTSIVRQALALHPGLYRYQSPALFEQRFARFAESWNRDASLEARFLALARLTAQIRCGHSHPNPFNQSKAIVAALFDRNSRIPFAFRWIEGQMVVTGDAGATTGIARGSEITRLNGKRPAAMLEALLPYARADGGADGKRIRQMELRGNERFEAFDIYQGLLFPPGANGHAVEWRDPAGKRHSATLPAISLAERHRLATAKAGSGDVIWDWQMHANGVVVLTMPDWVTYRSKWDWQGWLAERFVSLKGAKGLVIDLRDNEGGTDVGTFILQRLIDRPFRPVRYLNRVAFREAPSALRPYLDTWNPAFYSLGKGAVADVKGNLIIAGDEDEREILPADSRIPVPVAILVGPANSSATFSFARRVKESGAARLIGETTGGNLRGINGGAYFFVRLPESGLEFDVPLKGYFPEGPMPPDASVIPDQKVALTAKDIAAGRDRQMQAAVGYLLAA